MTRSRVESILKNWASPPITPNIFLSLLLRFKVFSIFIVGLVQILIPYC